MPNEHISSREFGALEQQVKHLDDKVTKLEERVEAASEKLDTLLALANQGSPYLDSTRSVARAPGRTPIRSKSQLRSVSTSPP